MPFLKRHCIRIHAYVYNKFLSQEKVAIRNEQIDLYLGWLAFLGQQVGEGCARVHAFWLCFPHCTSLGWSPPLRTSPTPLLCSTHTELNPISFSLTCSPDFSSLKVSSLRVGTMSCNLWGYLAPEPPCWQLHQSLDSVCEGLSELCSVLCPIRWPGKAEVRQLGWEFIHECFTFIISFNPYSVSFSPQDRHCCVCFTDKTMLRNSSRLLR